MYDSCDKCKEWGIKTNNIELPDSCKEGGDDIKTITYDDGTKVIGCIVEVSLTLSGIEKEVTNYPLMFVTDPNDVYLETANFGSYSGFLGLAESTDEYPSILKSMKAQQIITSTEIGLYLPRDGQGEGKLEFGDVSQSDHPDSTKSVTFQQESKNNKSYAIVIDTFAINGTKVAENFTAHLDTGFQGIHYPSSIQDKFPEHYKPHEGTGFYTSSKSLCNSHDTVSITIRGQEFTLDQKDLSVPSFFMDECISSITEINSYPEEEIWYFGLAFFHDVYSSINFENGEIKIAGVRE